MLTPAEIEKYQATGQVTPAFCLDAAAVDDLRGQVARFLKSNPDLDPDFVPGLVERDAAWLEMGAAEEITACVAGLLGENVILWSSALFCKQGQGGKATPWHQDGQYWPMRPLVACTVWIALDPSTPENGCLRVVPGSHKDQRIYDHDLGDGAGAVLNQEISQDAMTGADPLDVVLQPGQMSIHGAYTIHGAAANNSGNRRGGLVYRYMPASSLYDRKLAKELGEKQGIPIDQRRLYLVRGADPGANDAQKV